MTDPEMNRSESATTASASAVSASDSSAANEPVSAASASVSDVSVSDPLEDSPVLEQVLGDALPAMRMFHVKLSQEGVLRGLIGPREVGRIWERHILNSAALVPFIERFARKSRIDSLRIADVGSGAGFPGIVLAAMLPHDYFTLIEPMERRVDWLNEVIDELGLKNARVQRDRAEQLHGSEQFDIVTCRAVASMTKLTPWVMPLVHRGGELIALKGRSAQAEIDKAGKILRRYHAVNPRVFEAPVGQGLEPTHVVTVEKR